MNKKAFGEFLKTKRVAASLSQKDVADEMGYSTAQFISNWERGISTPPITSLKALARLYKIDATLILKELTEREQQWVKIKLAREFQRSR